MEEEFGQEEEFELWPDMNSLLEKDLQASLEPEVERFLDGIRDAQAPELFEEVPQEFGAANGEAPEEVAGGVGEMDSPLSMNPFFTGKEEVQPADLRLTEALPAAVSAEAALSSTSQDSMQTRVDTVNNTSVSADQPADDDNENYVGLSAVEIARRKAQTQAMESIGEKRKGSSDDEKSAKREKVNPSEPQEKVNQRRYQRRLQKNRDTAYISRIRRRAYTSLLEESLTKTENEKRRLNGVVDSLTSEIATLKAELRGLYANRRAASFSFGTGANLAPEPAVNDRQTRTVEKTPVMDLLKGIFRPIAPCEDGIETIEQMQAVPETRNHLRRSPSSAGRGSVMLMFSLLFVITIPGLFYGPTVTELVTFVAPPQPEDVKAAVWMDQAQTSNELASTTFDSPSAADHNLEGYHQALPDLKKLSLRERCSLSEYASSFECLQQGVDFNGELGSFRGGGIITAH